jgi:hypothetical protein
MYSFVYSSSSATGCNVNATATIAGDTSPSNNNHNINHQHQQQPCHCIQVLVQPFNSNGVSSKQHPPLQASGSMLAFQTFLRLTFLMQHLEPSTSISAGCCSHVHSNTNMPPGARPQSAPTVGPQLVQPVLQLLACSVCYAGWKGQAGGAGPAAAAACLPVPAPAYEKRCIHDASTSGRSSNCSLQKQQSHEK